MDHDWDEKEEKLPLVRRYSRFVSWLMFSHPYQAKRAKVLIFAMEGRVDMHKSKLKSALDSQDRVRSSALLDESLPAALVMKGGGGEE